LLTVLSLPLGACGTTSLFRNDPAPVIAPLVISPACMVDPVEPQPVEVPPIPPEIERPAGQPSAQTYPAWLTYEARRRERAELAGLFYQGERNAIEHAYELTAEQARQCARWARRQDQ
jgi:hypothetical protein